MPEPLGQRVLFMGSKAIGLRILQVLAAQSAATLIGAVVLDDRADARSEFGAFESLCQDSGVPFMPVSTRAESQAIVDELEPGLCVVAGWYWIIPPTMLASVPGGFIGIHHSLLPLYRGGAPVVWALINGEPIVGTSLFSLAPGMDAGPVWAQECIEVGPDEPIGSVLSRLNELAVGAFGRVLPGVLDGTLTPRPQVDGDATYCCQRIASDGLIDWNRPAAAVHNFIRAQSEPYPGAYTVLHGKPLHVWEARRSPERWSGTPGQVARIGPNGVYVVCGDSRCVELLRVTVDGRAARGASVIRSLRTRLAGPGEVLCREGISVSVPEQSSPPQTTGAQRE